jgi:hypothetical protein
MAEAELQKLSAGLLQGLRQQKAAGFELHWTVHNEVSHGSSAPGLEAALQRELCQLADTVWVHHPMARHVLPWLPEHTRLALVEHGPYPAPPAAITDKAKAKQALGLPTDGVLLVHTGLVRSYKGLSNWLPTVLHVLQARPELTVLIAGRISCEQTLAWLQAHPHPRLLVRNQFLDEQTLHTCMTAADWGWLSYERVLTSGALMHWLALGRPVLAPALGTLPAYVVPGWNGFLYRTANELQRWLDHALNHPQHAAAMAANANATGRTLRWPAHNTHKGITP